jgi:cytochrome oxidase Cu insertion factor (SCO1/SenC/PrrC family)
MHATRVFLSFLLLLGSFAYSEDAIEVGKEAPDFELADSAGKSYKLSTYRGEKAVVLEFFRSGDW